MRRRPFTSLLLATLVVGCGTPVSQPVLQPPPGAPTAGPAFPPIGARWTERVTDSGLFHSTVEDRVITATEVDFTGRRGYALAGPPVTTVLDPANFNPIGEIVGGRVAIIDTPDVSRFSWPLWVGKSWAASNAHSDLLKGMNWPQRQSQARVGAIETVTVPAGTFSAFRIEYEGGIGSSAWGGRHNQGGPGFETRDTYWYAPGPKMIVKSQIIRSGSNYLGGARTTTELLTLPR